MKNERGVTNLITNVCEDRLIAIESGSPAKIRVFTEGVDGHSLNAAAYFQDELKDRGIEIDMNSPNSINKIKSEAKDLRQRGKSVTFGFRGFAA